MIRASKARRWRRPAIEKRRGADRRGPTPALAHRDQPRIRQGPTHHARHRHRPPRSPPPRPRDGHRATPWKADLQSSSSQATRFSTSRPSRRRLRGERRATARRRATSEPAAVLRESSRIARGESATLVVRRHAAAGHPRRATMGRGAGPFTETSPSSTPAPGGVDVTKRAFRPRGPYTAPSQGQRSSGRQWV